MPGSGCLLTHGRTALTDSSASAPGTRNQSVRAGSTHYARKPGETTEWEDILRAKGVLGPDVEEEARKARDTIAAAAEAARERIDPLEGKSLEELDRMDEEARILPQ
jgi:hypothetical protein